MDNKRKPKGRLAVLLPGLGAVATTFVAGVDLARRGKSRPIGSLTQLGLARTGPGRRNGQAKSVPIRQLVPLAGLDDLVFGAWDIVSEDGARVAARSGVLTENHQREAREILAGLKPKKGIYDPSVVRRIEADHYISARSHMEKVETIRQDIRDYIRDLGATRAVMLFTASTEVFRSLAACTRSLEAFEAALKSNSPDITPSMMYAYAALQEGVPFANATPNPSVDLPALQELAREKNVPVAGKDLKSGQTFIKTVLAPAFRSRLLGLNGWFSTNILGNRDGEVLDDPEAFRSKEVTKTGVLETILKPEEYPDLYSKIANKVSIHYYPPRGDDKEGWDNIDIFGWMGYPMQIKVNFLCKDSILAAPLVLDLALFLDLGKRAEWRGIQEWLSFYFKSPMARGGGKPEHDLFAQEDRLINTLRALSGDESISHLGLDFDDADLPLPRK